MKRKVLWSIPILSMLFLAACATHNPFQYAKTPLDKAHVALRTLENVQEEVLTLVTDPATPSSAVSVLKKVSRDATTVAKQGGGLINEVESARADLIAGGATASGKLQVANDNLERWTKTLLERIASIKDAIKEARHG